MLPQGRFQAFLRARSEERHRLLQQLFRTERFEQSSRWLRERRIALHARRRPRRTVAELVIGSARPAASDAGRPTPSPPPTGATG